MTLAVTKADAQDIVARGAGPVLASHGFVASRHHLTYKRALPEGQQVMEFILAMNPPYARGALHFIPQYSWWLPRVGELCNEMAGGDRSLGDLDGCVCMTQIHNMAEIEARIHWYLRNPSEKDGMAAEQASYFERWVIPFAERYQSAHDLIEGYASHQTLLMGLNQVLAVSAALVLEDRVADAIALVESKAEAKAEEGFSYAPVLEYLRSHRP